MIVRLLLVVGWLACDADGFVAGCTWHTHIVLTSDVADHHAPAIHNAIPNPPLIDVTEEVNNLTVTGIRIDEQVHHRVIEWG